VTQRTFQMQNRLEDVDPMVMSLKAAVEGNLDHDVMVRFEICMSEALTNLASHVNVEPTVIDVTLALSHDKLTVEIFDPVGATPFDLRDHAVDLSSVEMLAENGRGLGLIMQCADAVDYGLSGDRNRLKLEFLKAGV
jgi:serine/threonine-protein kinase RsbW